MSGEINWKSKYQELKSKYMNAVDMAFRLGVEEGLKQGQLDSANQQLAQASAQQQDQAAGGGAPGGGDPSAGGGAGGQLPGGKQNNNSAPGTPDQGGGNDKSGAASVQPQPVSANPEGSELDQHIAKLESMISKSEDLDITVLKGAINDLKSLQKSQKEQLELAKSQMAISAISKAMHKPQFKFGVQASHNLSSTAKAAATMQQEIVQDVFKKWEAEEKKASKDILSTISLEGIIKGE
jgi:hypothetical protein